MLLEKAGQQGGDGRFDAQDAGAQLHRLQAGLGQQLQAATAVDRIVGNCHAGALGQVVDAFVFLRVQADVVDDARRVRHQVKTGGGLGVFQERDVLEVVHVDIAGSQADIGRDPVGELYQLDFQALFTSLGDGGLIATDDEDFVRKGIFLSGNIMQLAVLRADLRNRMQVSALADSRAIAQHMEQAFRTMWQRWCSGLPPASFAIAPGDTSKQAVQS